MAIPTQDLQLALLAFESLPDDVSVLAAPEEQIIAPAIVIRPAEPWRAHSAFCHDEQNYVAIAVVSAHTPLDGMAKLYKMTNAIIATIAADNSGWSWQSVGAPVVDETTGTAFLAAPVRLRYLNNEEEES